MISSSISRDNEVCSVNCRVVFWPALLQLKQPVVWDLWQALWVSSTFCQESGQRNVKQWLLTGDYFMNTPVGFRLCGVFTMALRSWDCTKISQTSDVFHTLQMRNVTNVGCFLSVVYSVCVVPLKLTRHCLLNTRVCVRVFVCVCSRQRSTKQTTRCVTWHTALYTGMYAECSVLVCALWGSSPHYICDHSS